MRPAALAPLVLVGLAALSGSCASVKFNRDTATSGTFRSTGLSFTILGVDLPKAAVDIARENASDARQPNLEVDEVVVIPDFGPFDWLLEIIGVRYARITGTWGFRGDSPSS